MSLGVIMAAGFPCDDPRGGGSDSSRSQPPRAPKRAVEDKPGQDSDKTFHYTTPAADASGFGWALGLL